MINRALIRIKVIQILFAYYQNPDRGLKAALSELSFSLDKAYELYMYLLLLPVALRNLALQRIDHGLNKLLPTAQDLNPNRRFVDNAFLVQLASNDSLAQYVKEHRISWDDHQDFLRGLLDRICSSEPVVEYMALPSSTYDQDRELWKGIFRNVILTDQDLDDLLEDACLYWNDDRETVDTYLLKTLNRFQEKNGAQQALMPQYKDPGDRELSSQLLTAAITGEAEYRELISGHIKNWDFSRVAFMDVVIMQVALCELLTVSGIPVTVTLNEYVEIAKCYSTPRSGGFVNGTLDGIVKTLRSQGRLLMK